MYKFHYLKMGVPIILIFFGVKILIARVVHNSTVLSLIIILVVLAVSIGASMIRNKRFDPFAYLLC